jgi:hypothetical protein
MGGDASFLKENILFTRLPTLSTFPTEAFQHKKTHSTVCGRSERKAYPTPYSSHFHRQQEMGSFHSRNTRVLRQVSWEQVPEHRNGQLSEQIIEAPSQWCARLAGIQH